MGCALVFSSLSFKMAIISSAAVLNDAAAMSSLKNGLPVFFRLTNPFVGSQEATFANTSLEIVD